MGHPSTDKHTRICPGSNQALLFPCERDQFNIAPEGNPGLLDAPCNAENRDRSRAIVVSARRLHICIQCVSERSLKYL